MDEAIIAALARINENERAILSGGYSAAEDARPAFADMRLKRSDYLWNVYGEGKMICGKPHTRFADIPIHSHNYIEMMYVCRGTVTHFIEGKTVVLREGEFLLLNRHAKHSIPASGTGDIGVNFIISPDFLTYAAGKYRTSHALCDFAKEDQDPAGHSRYLIYGTGGYAEIGNLFENLIRGTLLEKDTPQVLLTGTLSLVFQYLAMYPDLLCESDTGSTRSEALRRTVTDYIETEYRTASLTGLAGRMGMTAPYVSRLTADLFGVSFRELLRERRISAAEQLLSDSDLTVAEIAGAVGYENISFFHRLFREQYGMTPAKWRKKKEAGK